MIRRYPATEDQSAHQKNRPPFPVRERRRNRAKASFRLKYCPLKTHTGRSRSQAMTVFASIAAAMPTRVLDRNEIDVREGRSTIMVVADDTVHDFI